MSLLIEPSTGQFLDPVKAAKKEDPEALEKKRKENRDKRLWHKEMLAKKQEVPSKKTLQVPSKVETGGKKKAVTSPRMNDIKEKPIDLLNVSLKS